MESELQEINLKPPKQPDPIPDDRPLLKSVTTIFASDTDELEKKFAAYVRRDVYGTMGRGELPTKEKVLLGVALVTLVPVRVVAAMTILLLYYLICKFCTLCSVPNREDEQEDYAHMVGWRRIVVVQCGKALARLMLFILGFYWIRHSYRVENPTSNEENKVKPEEMGRPGVIISNHVSYLDILYHTSCSFPSFVAKRSVAKLPLVGLISKCLGCIYVQRESKTSDFKGVSAVVTERIREAHRNTSAPVMMLFPEGTTTNGEYLLPFKSGGFLANAPVLPVILNYHYQRFSPAWDSISGVRHVIFLLCQFVNYMEVTELPTYYPSQQEKDNPKLYANNVRTLMASEGNMILSDIGLAEKRIYQAALNGLFSQC
ncbi:lysophospholipid acyltransferase LPEAT1-like isoform X2 [Cicer arietinum]|uniref:Lysophospholipid acyltransferase LPEAT1-like isoform X2 n=1 Tax=Cicer arietinum TaxID=3827 RepID=A0A1S2Y492_CICAR|nr:lysophospholipid acyltransferase LPEAT1-like isoform X2 [Cicer arietinum]